MKINLRVTALIMMGSAVFVSAPLPLLAQHNEVNVREACRREIAGIYLQNYDVYEKSRQAITTFKDSYNQANKALDKAETTLKHIKAEIAAKDFDLNLAKQRDDAIAAVNLLKEQTQQYAKMLAQAEEEYKNRAREEKELQMAISKVFRFERLADRASGGYPFRLEYKAECPAYRKLCPLPEKDIAELLSLNLDNGKVPEPCRRYGSLSRIR